MLEALRHLLTRVPDVHLDLVGEDTLGGAIQRLATQLDLDGHVTFRGFQPSDALQPLYRAAHLCVVSSRHEAASVFALEAAASGVPVVGTAVGYLADWAPDQAVTVVPRDAKGLASAIARLIANPQRRHDLAAAARAWTLAHDADWTAGALDRLYHELAGRDHDPSATPGS